MKKLGEFNLEFIVETVLVCPSALCRAMSAVCRTVARRFPSSASAFLMVLTIHSDFAWFSDGRKVFFEISLLEQDKEKDSELKRKQK